MYSLVMRKSVAIFLVFLLTNTQINSAHAAISATKAKSIIRTFYYNYSKEYKKSVSAGETFAIKNNYPGHLITKLSYECAKSFTIGSTVIPDLSTVALDKDWKVTNPAADVNPSIRNKKLKGDTFIVTVTYQDFDENGIVFNTEKADVHVNIQNNKAYIFTPKCDAPKNVESETSTNA
jgi:hypothetical protein